LADDFYLALNLNSLRGPLTNLCRNAEQRWKRGAPEMKKIVMLRSTSTSWSSFNVPCRQRMSLDLQFPKEVWGRCWW
jgi:hypothetical protein